MNRLRQRPSHLTSSSSAFLTWPQSITGLLLGPQEYRRQVHIVYGLQNNVRVWTKKEKCLEALSEDREWQCKRFLNWDETWADRLSQDFFARLACCAYATSMTSVRPSVCHYAHSSGGSNTRFLGPIWVWTPNGISIGSAVVVQTTLRAMCVKDRICALCADDVAQQWQVRGYSIIDIGFRSSQRIQF